MIGITSSSVTGLQEKMAGNNKDVNLAFQSAEATLRNVEIYLGGSQTIPPTYPAGFAAMRTAAANDASQGTAGLYSFLQPYSLGAILVVAKNPAPAIGTSTGTNPTCPNPKTLTEPFRPNYCVDWNATGASIRYGIYPALVGTPQLTGVVRQPEYIIEELKSGQVGDGGGGTLEAGIPFVTAPQADIWFRITAHAWGSNANSVATVQSIVKITYGFCC